MENGLQASFLLISLTHEHPQREVQKKKKHKPEKGDVRALGNQDPFQEMY